MSEQLTDDQKARRIIELHEDAWWHRYTMASFDYAVDVSRAYLAEREKVEALHIALRASGERREEAERRVRQMEQENAWLREFIEWEARNIKRVGFRWEEYQERGFSDERWEGGEDV